MCSIKYNFIEHTKNVIVLAVKSLRLIIRFLITLSGFFINTKALSFGETPD